MMYAVRKIDNSLGDDQAQQRTEDLAAALNEKDYHIYWIGELPEYMDGINDHVTVMTAWEANALLLPVVGGDVGLTVYDPDGNMISHSEQRDYADHMMIIVNTQDELSQDTLAVLQDCTVNNHVPILIVGENNIQAFRDYLILIHHDYDQNSSFFFEITKAPVDDPIAPEVVAAGGREYADALLTSIIETFEDPAVVYVTPGAYPSQAQETYETVITEETTDAA
jgi:hypothetical protein